MDPAKVWTLTDFLGLKPIVGDILRGYDTNFDISYVIRI